LTVFILRSGFARVPKQDHLVCFLGGLLLLGSTEGSPFTKDIELAPEAQDNWILGEQLTKTCVDTYTQSKTGLGAEIVFYYKHPQEKVYHKDTSERAWYIDKRKPCVFSDDYIRLC
jgi:mannosyl-oligosaccharide alpha-1,2-mannosidase